jgi:hypothetical protein
MPVYTFLHDLLNVLVQIANKIGLQKKVCLLWSFLGNSSQHRLLLTPLPALHHLTTDLQLFDRRKVGQSVLMSSTHLGPRTTFFITVSCGFIDVGRHPLRENGYAI